MAYIGREPIYGKFERQSLTSDGSTTTFTLNYTIGSASCNFSKCCWCCSRSWCCYTLGSGGTQIIFTASTSFY